MSRPFHVPAGSRPARWVGDHDFRFLAMAEETGGTYSFMHITSPAGSGPGPHIHMSEEEAFYIVSGSITFRVGDESFDAGPGDFVHVPRGAVHGFSVGTEPATYVALYAPGGEERRFSEPGK